MLHYKALAKYITSNPKCPFFTVYFNRIKFNHFVGVIKVGNLTIEVLPKADNNEDSKAKWQSVLLQMLRISLKIDAKTSTQANINLQKHTVLESYLHHFLDEVDLLLHYGLVKKYRQQENNANFLRGKLCVHKHIIQNIAHKERFYVSHQIYDRNNLYNSILLQTIDCILNNKVSDELSIRCNTLMHLFPECTTIVPTPEVFKYLKFDRKTERYKKAIEFARIILLNYHPDIKGGRSNILAIMFDMNFLWEEYVLYLLKRACRNYPLISVKEQQKAWFWNNASSGNIRLIPDIIISQKIADKDETRVIVLDTKWKYEKKTSAEDVRQMYAYSKYFDSQQNFLVYPSNIEKDGKEKVKIDSGHFYNPKTSQVDKGKSCGLMFIDPFTDKGNEKSLNKELGKDIIETVKFDRIDSYSNIFS